MLQLRRSAGNNPAQKLVESKERKEGLTLLSSKIQKPRVMRVGGGILATVYFGQDQFILDQHNLQVVERLSEELRIMKKPTVIVDGHASTEGAPSYNDMLAQRRIQLVIAVLKSKLLDSINFGGKSYGELQPVVAEDAKSSALLEAQRAQNRRVVIFISHTPVSYPSEPIDLSLPVRPPTPEETLDRVLKEPPPSPFLNDPSRKWLRKSLMPRLKTYCAKQACLPNTGIS